MVAYEDLVVALTNWRINQGLPTGSDAFAAFETGSVDLALPVADPVELRTGEVLSIDDDGGIEEIHDADQDVSLADANGGDESYEAYGDVADNAGLDYEAAPHEAALDYAEETAYGDMPQMDDMEAAPAPHAENQGADDAGDGSYESAPPSDPRTEEVDVLATEDAIDQAIDASAEEVISEEFAADEMAVEQEIEANDFAAQEVDADDMDALEVAADDFDADEMPTKFGDDDGNPESTVMGIGIDELRPADKS